MENFNTELRENLESKIEMVSNTPVSYTHLIEMYGSDQQWGNPIARFIDNFNQQNPREKHKKSKPRIKFCYGVSWLNYA